MPRDSSKNAEEAGPRATDEANHRGGGEGGAADLHAGAADGDASMQRAQPSGDGALATGDTGEQVSPAQQTAATLQRLALSGDPAAQYSPEQMLFALGWNSANQQQQQQQQGRAGEREEALPRPVMSAAQNLGDIPRRGATGVGPPPQQQFMTQEQISGWGQEQEAYAQQQHLFGQQQNFAQQQHLFEQQQRDNMQRQAYAPPQQQQQQQQQWRREDFTQHNQQQQRREDFTQHHQHPYHGQPSGGAARGVSFPGLPPDARGVAQQQDGELARMQAALTAANARAAAADAENASLRARDAASEVGSEYGSVTPLPHTRGRLSGQHPDNRFENTRARPSMLTRNQERLMAVDKASTAEKQTVGAFHDACRRLENGGLATVEAIERYHEDGDGEPLVALLQDMYREFFAPTIVGEDGERSQRSLGGELEVRLDVASMPRSDRSAWSTALQLRSGEAVYSSPEVREMKEKLARKEIARAQSKVQGRRGHRGSSDDDEAARDGRDKSKDRVKTAEQQRKDRAAAERRRADAANAKGGPAGAKGGAPGAKGGGKPLA
jgi:hypothetical protein